MPVAIQIASRACPGKSPKPPLNTDFQSVAEIGLADELGAGMRNTYKYTKLYSGGTPEFIEGDVFRTVIPLTPIAVEKVGPQDITQVTTQVAILAFCNEPRPKAEIMEHCGYKNAKNFTQLYLRPLLTRSNSPHIFPKINFFLQLITLYCWR